MRLFIAINFDEQTKKNIISVQSRLRRLGQGSFSLPQNLHLTLAFLGEIEPKREIEIRSLMDTLTIPQMHLTFDRVGCFNRDGGDIWWTGLASSKELCNIQRQLCESLRECGFSIEDRRFSPHITLGRQVILNSEPDRAKLLGSPFSTDADTISLMQSERVRGKLTYNERYFVQA